LSPHGPRRSTPPEPTARWSARSEYRQSLAHPGGWPRVIHRSPSCLTPGRRADIILVDLAGPHTQPVHDLIATLVHSARSSDVRTTIVDGRVVMGDRELLTIDVQAVVKEMGVRMPGLLDRSHGKRIQDYDT
jgi:hypothetical protein